MRQHDILLNYTTKAVSWAQITLNLEVVSWWWDLCCRKETEEVKIGMRQRAGDMRRAAGVTCKRQEKEIGRESENDALQKEDAFITSPIMCPDHFPSPKAQSHYLSSNTTNISLSLSLLIPKPAKPIRAKGEGASRISLPNSLWRKKGSTSTKDRQLVFGRRNRSFRLNCLTIKIGQ